ncbi:MAG: T9SS type A sorting domain-containing protein, partial [Bacteroidota bacterium]
MKRIFLLIIALFSLTSLTVQAQNCTPDPAITEFGVFPLPDTSVVLFSDPTIGIDEFACPGQFFEYTFTAGVPPQLDVAPFLGLPTPLELPLDLVEIITVNGLEALGWTVDDNFGCDPDGCSFIPDQNEPITLGCGRIFGTAPMTPGDYPIVFSLEATVTLGVPTTVPLLYPDPATFPGNYIIRVLDPTDPLCDPLSVEDFFTENVAVSQNAPNPFSRFTEITLNSRTASTYSFQVYSLTGKLVHQEEIQAAAGENVIPFDGSG